MSNRIKYFVVDAFTDRLFSGNPAGVCILEQPLKPALMQKIASENNLSETAFVLKHADQDAHYDLRWFTPSCEIDLCGHATLATAFVLQNCLNMAENPLAFHTASGILTVEKQGDWFCLDFPARPPQPVEVTATMQQAVGVPIQAAFGSRDLLLLLESEQQVQQVQLDRETAKNLRDYFGIIITAKGEQVDFVSRFFAPNAGIEEDPVTGSSHTILCPFWAGQLGKTELTAQQLSKRGGNLSCTLCADRVKIAGQAVLYLKGELFVR
ncbi:MAG: PhzF family phenazine biosynthesis protein [Thermoguttaceae bacterium]